MKKSIVVAAVAASFIVAAPAAAKSYSGSGSATVTYKNCTYTLLGSFSATLWSFFSGTVSTSSTC
jgi:hypothetical protein